MMSDLVSIQSSQEYSTLSEMYVPQETQQSVNVMTQVEKYLTFINTSNTTVNETRIHDQKDTNLCHSYATIKGFRQILRYFLRTKISVVSLRDSAMDSMRDNKPSSFNKMLAVFVGCINPRSFDQLFKVIILFY